jgi:hypothetical protein
MKHKQQEQQQQQQQHNHAEHHQHDDDVLQKRSSSRSSSSSSSSSSSNNNNNNNSNSSSGSKYYHKSCRRYSISLKEPLSKQYLDNYYSHRISYTCSNNSNSNSNIRDEPFHLPEPPSIPQEMLKGYRIIKGLKYSLLNDEQIQSISNNNKSDIYKCNYMADIERILQKRDALHCLSRY